MAAKTLDRLPLLVLKDICSFLVDADDYEERTALHAFALASKTCLAAATPQRFRQILLWPVAADADGPADLAAPFPRDGIRRWIELLDKYDGWRHVRRLRVTNEPGDRASMKDVAGGWDLRHIFDVDPFLRPLSRPRYEPADKSELLDSANFVHLLSTLLLGATGLQDLVWVPENIPPRIVHLLATQLPRCRLHMHEFQLWSLCTTGGEIARTISDRDWALATSPNLCAVVAGPILKDPGGIYPLEPALIRMMGGGVAPNLQHVSLENGQPIGSGFPELGGRIRIRSNGPPRAGFHPHEEAGEDGRGTLRSLAFRYGVTDEILLRCGELTDLTKLRHLMISGRLDSQTRPGRMLASQARAGAFHGLTCLSLQAMDERGSELWALNELLETVGQLQHLHLRGFVGNDSFDVILRRHGPTLRSLHMDPYGDFGDNDGRKPSELLRMSAPDVQRLVDRCPHLAELEIPLSRSHGDSREVSVYRALARLRHLRRAWLKLYYWVGPDENASDDVSEDDMYQGWDDSEVTLPHIKSAIADCAMDETLARSVFDIISGGEGAAAAGRRPAGLRWLRLDILRRQGRFSTPGQGSSYFDGLMELFTRDWVVERRRGESHSAQDTNAGASRVVVTELHADKARRAADEQWPFHDEWQHDERQRFKTAFEELWQPRTDKPEWWKDWHSFPLQQSPE